MKIINQSHEIISLPDNLLQLIEAAGRTCYKSEDKITEFSAYDFTSQMIHRGHHAMIEFGDIIVRFITNRGVTHELVRHRLCSFAQESTRYVRYDGQMEFIRPVWCSDKILGRHINMSTAPSESNFFTEWCFIQQMLIAESAYIQFLNDGWRPEQAREVLPNSLKTEIIVKANIREWRHILTLRTSRKAHPQIRALMLGLLAELQKKIPVVFDGI